MDTLKERRPEQLTNSNQENQQEQVTPTEQQVRQWLEIRRRETGTNPNLALDKFAYPSFADRQTFADRDDDSRQANLTVPEEESPESPQNESSIMGYIDDRINWNRTWLEEHPNEIPFIHKRRIERLQQMKDAIISGNYDILKKGWLNRTINTEIGGQVTSLRRIEKKTDLLNPGEQTEESTERPAGLKKTKLTAVESQQELEKQKTKREERLLYLEKVKNDLNTLREKEQKQQSTKSDEITKEIETPEPIIPVDSTKEQDALQQELTQTKKQIEETTPAERPKKPNRSIWEGPPQPNDRETPIPAVYTLDDEHVGVKNVITPLPPYNDRSSTQMFYDYLCSTREIDMDFKSPIYQELNKRLKMMQPDKKEARLFIMKKGGLEAFVHPDGTMFLSQAVINAMDTVDQVVGIMAHEMGHIVNETSIMAAKASNEALRFGTIRLHEAVSDTGMYLMDKAQMNTGGIGDALAKLNEVHGWGFDPEHGSGGTREMIAEAPAHILHFKYSNKPLTPLPPEWRREEKETNLKIGTKIIKEGNIYSSRRDIKQALEKMHPLDLQKLTEEMSDGDKSEVMSEIVSERLLQKGYSKEEVGLFLISNKFGKDAPIIDSQEMWINLSKLVNDPNIYIQLKKMHKDVFFEERNYQTKENFPALTLAKRLENRYSSQENYTFSLKDPSDIDEDSFITIMTNINNTNWDLIYDRHNSTKEKDKLLSDIAVHYISIEYGKYQNGQISENDITTFIHRWKAAGLPLNLEAIETAKIYGKRYNTIDVSFQPHLEFLEHTVAAIYEVPLLQKAEEGKVIIEFDQELDELINELKEGAQSRNEGKYKNVENFIKKMKSYFEENHMDTSQKNEKIRAILEKVRQTPFTRKYNFAPFLKGEDLAEYQDEKKITKDKKEYSGKIAKLNLQLVLIRDLSQEDGDEFYQMLQTTMETSEIDYQTLSKIELWNLSDVLLTDTYHDFHSYHMPTTMSSYSFNKEQTIKNYEKLFQLPMLQELINKREPIPTTMEELKNLTKKIKKETSSQNYPNMLLFADNMRSNILFRESREAFHRILANGVKNEDYPHMYEIISELLPEDPTKIEVLKELNRRYLSSDASIEDKSYYLSHNFDRIGVEGITTLGEQINTPEEYLNFRRIMQWKMREYLHPNETVTKIAATDLVASLFTEKFETIFKTAIDDPTKKKETTQQVAETWTKLYFGDEGKANVNEIIKKYKLAKESDSGIVSEYDPKSGKIRVDDAGQMAFRTLEDAIGLLKSLTQEQRAAVVAQFLGNNEGAFASTENRSKTAEIITQALKTEGFINTIVTEACKVAPLRTVGFPLSTMLGPLIFEGIDPSLIDTQALAQTPTKNGKTIGDYVPIEKLNEFIHDSTRNVVAFGLQYINYPESAPAQIMRQSESDFYQSYDLLQAFVPKKEIKKTKIEEEEQYAIDKGTEAVIKAGERGSALTVRGMQLLSELYDFENEDFNRRLSETLDNGLGMTKAMFWENLYQLSEKGKTDPDMKIYTNIFEKQLISLGDTLGNGSEFSTRSAVIKNKLGIKKKVALHFLMPNAERHIGHIEELGKNVFDAVEQNGTSEEKEYAKVGRYIWELGSQWCKRDINNPTFERDDKKFQGIIKEYNRTHRSHKIKAPKLEFTSYYLYADELVDNATTVNRYINDKSVNNEKKAEVIDKVLNFLEYQLKDAPSIRDETGQAKYIVHVDPHLGNHMIQTNNTEGLLSVIDRRMPLIVSKAHMEAATALYEGDKSAFVSKFIEAICEENKIRAPREKLDLAKSVLFAVGKHLNVDVQTEYSAIEEKYLTTTATIAEKKGLFARLKELPNQVGQFRELLKDDRLQSKGLSKISEAQAYAQELQLELTKLQALGEVISQNAQNNESTKDIIKFRKVVAKALEQKGITLSLDIDLLFRIPGMMTELKRKKEKLTTPTIAG